MRYDARRFKKAARSISAQATTRSRTSPLRKAHIVDRFTRRFWMFSCLNWSRWRSRSARASPHARAGGAGVESARAREPARLEGPAAESLPVEQPRQPARLDPRGADHLE